MLSGLHYYRLPLLHEPSLEVAAPEQTDFVVADDNHIIYDDFGRVAKVVTSAQTMITDYASNDKKSLLYDSPSTITITYSKLMKLSLMAQYNSSQLQYSEPVAGESIEVKGLRFYYSYNTTGELSSYSSYYLTTDGQEVRMNLQQKYYDTVSLGSEYYRDNQLVGDSDELNNIQNEYRFDQSGDYLRQTMIRKQKSNGRELEQTTGIYDYTGRLLSSTDVIGRTTTYRYDDKGNTVKVDRPYDDDIEISYQQEGDVLYKTTLQNGVPLSYEALMPGTGQLIASGTIVEGKRQPLEIYFYDDTGKSVRKESWAANGTKLGETENYYDGDFIYKEVNTLNNGSMIITYNLQSTGRFSEIDSTQSDEGITVIGSVVFFDGKVTTPNVQLDVFSLDNLQNKLASYLIPSDRISIEALNQAMIGSDYLKQLIANANEATHYTFDAQNRVTAIENSQGIITQKYNVRGLPTVQTGVHGAKDYTFYSPTGEKALKAYQPQNDQQFYPYYRRVFDSDDQEVVTALESGPGLIEKKIFEYDDKGRKTRQSESNGYTTTYSYLPDTDLPLEEQRRSDNGQLNYDLAYEYTEEGRIKRITDLMMNTKNPEYGKVDMDYNAAGQLLTYHYRLYPNGIESGYAGEYDANYHYDRYRRLIQVDLMIFNHPLKVSYEYYDSAGIDNGKLKSMTVGPQKKIWLYNSLGLLAREKIINNGTTVATIDYQYDRYNRLIDTQIRQADGVLQQQYRYGYDYMNQIMHLVNQQDVMDFTLNADHELVNFSLNQADVVSYRYDTFGNTQNTYAAATINYQPIAKDFNLNTKTVSTSSNHLKPNSELQYQLDAKGLGNITRISADDSTKLELDYTTENHFDALRIYKTPMQQSTPAVYKLGRSALLQWDYEQYDDETSHYKVARVAVPYLGTLEYVYDIKCQTGQSCQRFSEGGYVIRSSDLGDGFNLIEASFDGQTAIPNLSVIALNDVTGTQAFNMTHYQGNYSGYRLLRSPFGSDIRKETFGLMAAPQFFIQDLYKNLKPLPDSGIAKLYISDNGYRVYDTTTGRFTSYDYRHAPVINGFAAYENNAMNKTDPSGGYAIDILSRQDNLWELDLSIPDVFSDGMEFMLGFSFGFANSLTLGGLGLYFAIKADDTMMIIRMSVGIALAFLPYGYLTTMIWATAFETARGKTLFSGNSSDESIVWTMLILADLAQAVLPSNVFWDRALFFSLKMYQTSKDGDWTRIGAQAGRTIADIGINGTIGEMINRQPESRLKTYLRGFNPFGIFKNWNFRGGFQNHWRWGYNWGGLRPTQNVAVNTRAGNGRLNVTGTRTIPISNKTLAADVFRAHYMRMNGLTYWAAPGAAAVMTPVYEAPEINNNVNVLVANTGVTVANI